jgi:hypothetical protein
MGLVASGGGRAVVGPSLGFGLWWWIGKGIGLWNG